MSDNIKKTWEVLLPAPLVLDEEISDEEIISELASIESESEASSIFSSAMSWPMESYIVSCSRDELFDIIATNNKEINLEIEEYSNIYVILIKDAKNDEVIGRGEISELGKRTTLKKLQTKFNNNLIGFKDKFEKGQARMNGIAFKLKTLSNDMNLIAYKQKTGKNNN